MNKTAADNIHVMLALTTRTVNPSEGALQWNKKIDFIFNFASKLQVTGATCELPPHRLGDKRTPCTEAELITCNAANCSGNRQCDLDSDLCVCKEGFFGEECSAPNCGTSFCLQNSHCENQECRCDAGEKTFDIFIKKLTHCDQRLCRGGKKQWRTSSLYWWMRRNKTQQSFSWRKIHLQRQVTVLPSLCTDLKV